MDDIFLPDETDNGAADEVDFKKSQIDEGRGRGSANVDASNYVKITFDRFVTLVANHSFIDVVERNKDEEVIMSTNLLTDLANARGISPKTRGPILVLAGVVVGIFIAYFIF
ncbi:hypothetical protein KKC94_02645 [Patescibacteria group bacterium]|nr:hypothetical protein [Patescibacteria group bacterium]